MKLSKAITDKPIQIASEDLLPIIRNHYYHREFNGSFSIKDVLPVLKPNAGWSELHIDDGMAAAMTYGNALQLEDESTHAETFNQIIAYCRQDALAIVELRPALYEPSRKTESAS